VLAVTHYLTLAAMLGTVAWFFWNPEGWTFEWEPIVVFLLALTGFITTDFKNRNTVEDRDCAGTPERDPADINLYLEFTSVRQNLE